LQPNTNNAANHNATSRNNDDKEKQAHKCISEAARDGVVTQQEEVRVDRRRSWRAAVPTNEQCCKESRL
jgi:hypothetical protein